MLVYPWRIRSYGVFILRRKIDIFFTNNSQELGNKIMIYVHYQQHHLSPKTSRIRAVGVSGQTPQDMEETTGQLCSISPCMPTMIIEEYLKDALVLAA